MLLTFARMKFIMPVYHAQYDRLCTKYIGQAEKQKIECIDSHVTGKPLPEVSEVPDIFLRNSSFSWGVSKHICSVW